MKAKRALDHGNATSDSLNRDFALIRLPLWLVLDQAYARSPDWKASLNTLIVTRNAIAHSDESKLRNLHITLREIKKWRRDLDRLAGSMDDVVSAYLGQLLRRGRPW